MPSSDPSDPRYFNARPVILRGHPLLFAICLLVPWVGWLYLAYWFIDNAGTRVQVTDSAVRETKWFGLAAMRVNVPLSAIQATSVDRGWYGSRWNTGTLTMTLDNGERVSLPAVESPDALKLLIEKLRA